MPEINPYEAPQSDLTNAPATEHAPLQELRKSLHWLLQFQLGCAFITMILMFIFANNHLQTTYSTVMMSFFLVSCLLALVLLGMALVCRIWWLLCFELTLLALPFLFFLG
jgi:hypothetical protein